MAMRPTSYPTWTQGLATQVLQPSTDKIASGFVGGEQPTYQTVNYLLWMLGAWVTYLDTAVTTSVQTATLDPLMRIDTQATFTWVAATGALSWSQPINISVPGSAANANTIAQGQITLSPGQCAWVAANVPMTVTGTLTNASTQVSAVSSTSGLAVGQAVSGTGIAAGTVITEVGTTTLTLSLAATQDGSDEALTCVASGTLNPQVTAMSALAAAPNTVIFAFCSSAPTACVQVGINAATMVLRDGEQKAFGQQGYLGTLSVTAGQDLSFGQAVYVGQDGRARVADASVNGTQKTATVVGLCTSNIANGAIGLVATGGAFVGLTSLTPGAAYYLNPDAPGGVTTTEPGTAGQWIAPLGVAASANALTLALGAGAAVSPVANVVSWTQYPAGSETQLQAAIAACQQAQGGVICVTQPFVAYNAHTVPSGTILVGRRGGAVVTMASGATLTLADGADVRDCAFASASGGSATILSLPNNFSRVSGCQFTMAAGNITTSVLVSGNANTISQCVFVGTSSPSCCAINYQTGAGNTDTQSVFLS